MEVEHGCPPQAVVFHFHVSDSECREKTPRVLAYTAHQTAVLAHRKTLHTSPGPSVDPLAGLREARSERLVVLYEESLGRKQRSHMETWKSRDLYFIDLHFG